MRTQIRSIEENQRNELRTGVNVESKSTEQRRIRYRFSLGVHIHPYSLCLANFSACYFVCRYVCVCVHCVSVLLLCAQSFCAFLFAHLFLSLCHKFYSFAHCSSVSDAANNTITHSQCSTCRVSFSKSQNPFTVRP